MNILFIADIVGKPGRRIVAAKIDKIKRDYRIDFVIANGENSAGGFGITPPVARELFGYGIDAITTGNHVWNKKEILDYIKEEPRLLRPFNLPAGLPGNTIYYKEIKGIKVALFSLLGRVFMGSCMMADCPFAASSQMLEESKRKSDVILVEIHAEATSEKLALGYFLDGKVSAVVGSHTHISTTDARILPGGTAYVTDIGMTGPVDSVIGVDKDIIINKFLTQIPVKFEVARGQAQLEGVIIKDVENKERRSMERIAEVEANL